MDELIAIRTGFLLAPILMWSLFLGALIDYATDNYDGPRGPDLIGIDNEYPPLFELVILLLMALLATGFSLYLTIMSINESVT